jgi:chemotaxis protein methyltransferase CheR
MREKAYLNLLNDFLESVREPLVVLGADLKVIKANQAFYRIFAVDLGETEGTLIYEIGNHQWDIPKLKELLETILPQNTAFNDFEVEHTFETIGFKIMHLNARRIYREKNKTQFILLAIEDVTEREYYKRHLEEIVKNRTVELRSAREAAEELPLRRSKNYRSSLRQSEHICRKRSSWNSIMTTSLDKATKSNTSFIRWNRLPQLIPMS